MLSFLFRGLTAERPRGTALFDAVTAEARRPHWYVEGGVPDTLDGRFAVLVTLTALVLVRIERDGEAGDSVSVALTERFIAVMESEHRDLGLGDPTLGRTVRKLVGILARRAQLWRGVKKDWVDAARSSLYKDNDEVADAAVGHSAGALRDLKRRLEATSFAELEQGAIA